MNEIIQVHASPVPASVGQATAVEQSRAVAEVLAAVQLAQQCPRDVQAALASMKDSCAQKFLAERASFRFSRGGSQVSGPSVHLARELARCWGHLLYGVKEMRRDDVAGESEMMAYAWDVQSNTRNETVFIVPHKRDRSGGPVKLTDMRDIYENNANAAARRVRECIFNVLPPWFTEQAKQACRTTLEDGGGKPIAERVADAIARYAAIAVTEDQLERKLGRKTGKWTAADIATLIVIYTSISNGEATVAEEFPQDKVSVADIGPAAVGGES